MNSLHNKPHTEAIMLIDIRMESTPGSNGRPVHDVVLEVGDECVLVLYAKSKGCAKLLAGALTDAIVEYTSGIDVKLHA